MSWDWTPELLDRLRRELTSRGLLAGPISTRRVGDGHSNLTYLVTDGERRVVVRRPPAGPVPRGAHNMLREARILGALQATEVPVPGVLAVFEEGELLDVACYVMSHVAGPVVTTGTPPALIGHGCEIGEALVDVLAALHAVDWRLVGGNPEGFNARHLTSVGRLVPDHPPEGFAELGEWLVAHVPAESGASVVHNDYRLGNVVLHPRSPGRVAAVLDWELATVGDPLFDVGYFLASVPQDKATTPTEELGVAMLEDDWPTRDELAGRYADASGRDLGALSWYVVLAQWKLAALYEYQRRRGTDSYYHDPAMVAAFVAAGERASST